jgi:hypothetical protein
MNETGNHDEYSAKPQRYRLCHELILEIDDLIPLLLVIGFAHLNLWVECGNAMCFHLGSMGGACNEISLVRSVPQKSTVCLRAQKN